MPSLFTDAKFDACATSYNEWQHLGRLLKKTPEWRDKGEAMLESVAIVTNANSRARVQPCESNISDILKSGRGDCVRYLVFHATESQSQLPEAILYWRLTEAVCLLTGQLYRARFPPDTPSLICESVAELVEVVLCAMPNVRGILIACAENLPMLMSRLAARHITYCAMIERVPGAFEPVCEENVCSLEMQPFLAPTRDRLLPRAEVEPQAALPLALSSFDSLHSRPLLLSMEQLLTEATDGTDTVCVHEVPEEPSPHVRRHILFNPAQQFLDSRGNHKAYDWCQIVASENRITGLE
ncbi:hypothetical protein H4R21_002422 [Coemansia helicoidea]|uniref:Uncharacterized protein n=1 Tax=Coemansia helicoidea TaxID=1286919 RepID=A0ACC1L7H9_9FUNG|nr:hypothetical protein H4R21_002422 [Coemansia helicoidea]